MRMRHQILVIGLAVAVGCQEPGIAPGNFIPGQNPLEHLGTCSLNPSQTTSGYYGAPTNWGCSATIAIWDPSGLYTTDMNSARSEWNSAIFGSYGLPSFSAVQTSQPTGHYIKLVIDISGGTNYFCGAFNGSPGDGSEMYIDGLATQTQNCPLPGGSTEQIVPAANVWMLMLHEMGHAIGFSHLKTKPSDYNCVMSIGTNTPPGLVGAPCPEEAQMVYYNYSLRSSAPSVTQDFIQPGVSLSPATGNIPVTGSLSVTTGFTGLGTNPTPTLNWSVSGAASITSSSSSGATIQNNVSGQTASLTASIVDYDVISWPTNNVTDQYNVFVQPPTNLAVGTVTQTTAALTWTDGDALATTTVQDKGSSWSTVTSVGAGGASYTISGLKQCSTYSAQVYHVRNGANSTPDSVINGIQTAGACTPTGFLEGSCTDSVVAGQTDLFVYTRWRQSRYSTGANTEIKTSTTNDTTTGSIVYTGSAATTSTTLGGYNEGVSQNIYFWIRDNAGGGYTSAWLPMTPPSLNPHNGAAGCP